MIAKLTKRRAKHDRDLRDAMPIFTIEDDLVVLTDGRIAAGWQVEAPEMEQWTAHQYESFNQSFSRQLATLPVGAVVQKTDIYFDRTYQHPPMPTNNGNGKIPYFERKLATHFGERLVLHHQGYLFVSLPPAGAHPYRVNALNTYLNYGRALAKNPFKDITQRLPKAGQQAAAFVDGMGQAPGLTFKRLDGDALRKVYTQWYRLAFDDKVSASPADMQAATTHLAIGHQKVNIVSMIGQGAEVDDVVLNHYGVASPYTYALTQYLQFPHILTQCVLIEDTQKQLRLFDLDKKLNRSMDWLTTQDHEVKAAALDAFTESIRQEGNRLVSVNINVILYGPDEHGRAEQIEKVVSGFRAMSGAEALVESIDTAALFFANTPGAAFNHYRWLVTTDRHAVCYFQFITNYYSALKGDYLCDRFRNLLKVDFFNTDLANQNAVVIGPSGTGKSFTVGTLIAQRHERKCRQVIIDVGGTYKNTVLALNGKQFDDTYFEYDPERPLQFNPFSLPGNSSQGRHPTGEKINSIISVLSTIWKGGRGNHLSQAERSVLQMALKHYYQHLAKNSSMTPNIRTFYRYCQSLPVIGSEAGWLKGLRFFDMEEFLTVLLPFVEGDYAKVLNADHTIDLAAYPLTCFDLARIKSDPVLYPVVAVIITQLAIDQITRFPEEEKYIYMEEAWSMISGEFSEFMEQRSRTNRKSKASIWTITQGINEIINAEIGAAILVNADIKVLLKHTDQKILHTLATELGLTDRDLELLQSLRHTQEFREVLVKMGEHAKVYLLEPPPALAAVLSSKPDERNTLMKYLDRSLHFDTAMANYLDHINR